MLIFNLYVMKQQRWLFGNILLNLAFTIRKPEQLESLKIYRRHFDKALETVLKTSTRTEKSYQKLEGAMSHDLYS